MAVLVEGHTVIVRRDAIARLQKGGWTEFEKRLARLTHCYDDDIVAVMFTMPWDIDAFTKGLMRDGYVMHRDNKFIDFAYVDQIRGLMLACDWLETTTGTIDDDASGMPPES